MLMFGGYLLLNYSFVKRIKDKVWN
jgi:hypothetical protein